ncbi:MAG: TIGR00366 family protein [Acidobacteria bacterium]|nr:TIGR00366 family protein [Acidobacteriota bacterium]
MKATKASRVPDSLVLIFGLIVLAQLATYVLPAGEFDRVGRQVVRGSFHTVDAEPLPPFTFLTAVPDGLTEAADIIFFVLIVGGVFGVLRTTGALDALIGVAIRRVGGRPVWLVGGMLTLFALGSATVGMAEEYVPFVPLLVAMCLALKADAVVALGIVYVGAGVGYACAALNPFTVLIAQNIAGVQLTSGQGPRWLLLAICLAIGTDHILRYMRQIQADPTRSVVRDVSYTEGFDLPDDLQLTTTRSVVIGLLVAGVGLFVYGVGAREWYLTELTAVFLGIALSAAVVAGLSPNRVAGAFCLGAAELSTTALTIGFARTIQVVLTEGQVIDTVIYGLAAPLSSLPSYVAALGMLAVQTACNLFIPSGSGQAYVTMPIMAPIADLTGLTRQTAVLAYQLGDGFTNMVFPTNAVLMGMLTLARVPYQRWLTFVGPLLLKLYLVAALALMVAVRYQY